MAHATLHHHCSDGFNRKVMSDTGSDHGQQVVPERAQRLKYRPAGQKNGSALASEDALIDG